MKLEKYEKFKMMLLELEDGYILKTQKDNKGVLYGWCFLKNSDEITTIALMIKQLKGRLVTLTAYNLKKKENRQIAYHFDLDGVVCTVTINVENKVKSITPILKAADWTERELQELYDIEVISHPNPKRLFLDESIDSGVMNNLISLSEAMSGASSQTLWEKVISSNLKKDLK